MADFKIIETQEQFDERIKERLERAEKSAANKAREEFAGWTSPDDLKALNDAHAQELEALRTTQAKELEKYAGYDEKFTAQEKKIHELETSALKFKIATEKGLSPEAVEFLKGDSEDAIKDSADKLVKLSGGSPVGFTKNTEPRTNPTAEAFREIARKYGKAN